MIALRGLPFLPCFAVGGSRLQFCAVSPPTETERYPTLHECSDIFDMTISDQRLSIMRISLNMLCAISILRAQMPTAAEIVPLYKAIDRGDECFGTVLDDHVKKICRPAPLSVYDALKGLPYTIEISNRKDLQNGRVSFQIRPVCIQCLPSTEDELCSAISHVLTAVSAFRATGHVHRDIRWPNVLKSHRGWLLGDFEFAVKTEDSVPPLAISSKFLPPEVALGQPYSFPGDIYFVGMLLMDWNKAKLSCKLPGLSDDGIAWSKRLIVLDPAARPTASALLAERGTWLCRT